MKTAVQILICLFFHLSAACQQYYLRGEVRDERGNVLQNVHILNPRTGYVYKSGSAGTFGITNTRKSDTLQFSHDGFKTERVLLDADVYSTVRLKAGGSSASNRRQSKLASFTRGMRREDHREWYTGDESYASILENHFINASRFPVTGLSLNVDRASYSNIRRFITTSTMVPPDAVRIEEMLNYFNLSYSEPSAGQLFDIKTKISSCPWNPASNLYYINLSARRLDLEKLPPSHLVFLIDVSGSMDMTNRLPLLQSAFRMLVNNLRSKDTVSIVAYGGVTGVMMHPTSGAEKDSILRAIDALTPGGSTPGESGIKLAYSIAKSHFIPGGNNRVILATDGDFNVGLRTETDLDDMISQHRSSGIYLTCLGVGMGNYKDSKIQTLARKGNGNFAYIDNFGEAEKVMLKEFTQTLYAVADDAYMNVEFNPKLVKEYRLLGFDNKVGPLNDSTAIIEGGEIGSGYSMMGIFEVQLSHADTAKIERFADIRLSYKPVGDSVPRLFSYRSPFDLESFERLDSSYRFATAVAQFGSMLRASIFAKLTNWNDMATLAVSTADPADKRQQEFVTLVQQARTLYGSRKKKKKPLQ